MVGRDSYKVQAIVRFYLAPQILYIKASLCYKVDTKVRFLPDPPNLTNWANWTNLN